MFRIDPVEAEPLYHFHPGTRVMRASGLPSDLGSLISAALGADARSVAVPPDLSRMRELARAGGLRDVHLVSSCPDTRLASRFGTLRWVDGLVVDITSTDVAASGFALDEIARLLLEDVWVELRCTLLEARGDHAIDELTRRVLHELGPEVPLHLATIDTAASSSRHLEHARWIAASNGLHWVYGGEETADHASSSWCPGCDGLLATRTVVGGMPLDAVCPTCGWPVPGRFARDARRRSSTQMRRVATPAPLLKRVAH